ncbi:lysophosphatidic acid acyltransferase LOA1 Ecym_4409 [Eremothecium cymbalariae DBVPG|uniref:Phospholipid/glycerol acyltransferase domain-containing protein n=1 Tax=Eremothecium cymbalariae (strain CBS 270.75 / DBVPG 7215 / KCTC 17166 / NRRL Y-17582) TaxID=931890 RepID=G8JTV9_ERECY|nr:hypothetical protein Ecym_4409 [Eremothecium cymbalariae DBVPG\
MEKYTNWMDKGTGIKPFIPIKSPRAKFGSCMVLMVKGIIVLPLALLWMLLQLTGVGSKVLGTAIMKFLFGWSSQIHVEGVKRSDISNKHMPEANRLYIVNYISPLDGIFLSLISQAPVVLLVPRRDKLYWFTPWQLFKFTLGGALDIPKGQPHIEDPKLLKADSAFFILAEGTTSTGRTVLPFELGEDTFSLLTKEAYSKVYPVSLSLTAAPLCTPVAIGFWKYLSYLSAHKVCYKCRIMHPVNKADLATLRVTLVGGDKYMLVGKNMNLESKKKFVNVWTAENYP